VNRQTSTDPGGLASAVGISSMVPHGSRNSARVLDGLLFVAPLTVFAILATFVLVDPTSGVTASHGPFTDEAWNVVNARNFVLLGRFATDDWNLHLVNLPFSLVEAAVFSVAGVGMAQARLVSIAAVAMSMAALGFGLRGWFGRGAALLASVGLGTSALVLYYGRLAFLEPSVALGLTVGGLLTLRAHDRSSGRWGFVAGVALAIAIGTKPSAAFAGAGIVIGLAAVGAGAPAVRRWLGGAVLAILLAGITWVVLIGLPNRDAVATDLRIWASEPIVGPLSVMAHQVLTFATRNDGFLGLAAPLLLVGGLGWTIAFRARRNLGSAQSALFAATTGWLVAGLGILSLAPYRPNRYEVPLLPALAILSAIGWSVVLPRLKVGTPSRATAAGLAVACVIAAPGLLAFGGWMTMAQRELPAVQAQVRAILPAGAVVQGDLAPAFALRAPVETLVSRPPTRVNPGDLYQSHGVRWYVGATGTAPAWARLHPEAWASRVPRLCESWGGDDVCVWQLQ